MTRRELALELVTKVRAEMGQEPEPLRVCQKQSWKGFSHCPSPGSLEAEPDTGVCVQVIH